METRNYFGYTVYEDGRILGKKGLFLVPQDNGKGYLITNLMINGKRVCKAIHRILAEAFIPNPENLSDVDHIDGNRQNNNLDNLRWVTHGNNIKHSFDLNNRSATGTDNANNIFDVNVVVQICDLLQSGLMPAAVRDLGYNYYLVRSIRSRKNWTHISKNYSW